MRGVSALICRCISAVAFGDITLVGGSFSLTLKAEYAWTITEYVVDGVTVVDPGAGSFQGTVVWLGVAGANDVAGSGHGAETPLELHLFVDGVEVTLQDGQIYSGHSFVFSKISILERFARALRLESMLTVNNGGCREDVTLTVLTPDTWIPTLYLWLSSHSDSFTHYAARSALGERIAGDTLLDDNFLYRLPTVHALIQTESILGGALRTRFEDPSAGDAVLIWDRPDDNKVYWLVATDPRAYDVGTTWHGTVSRKLR